MIMITYFDLKKTHAPAAILQIIKQIDKENRIVVIYSDNTMRQYSRETMYDFEIAEEIYDYICEKQIEMLEAALEEMYNAHCDEMDAMFEIEDMKAYNFYAQYC